VAAAPGRGAAGRAADAVRRRWGSNALAPASLLGDGGRSTREAHREAEGQ